MYKWIIACCLLLLACKKEEEPSVLAPRISLNEVTEITRNTARISAEIELRGEGTVTSCKFLYGTSEDMAEALQQEAEGVEGNVETCLTGLQAGTSYYYCLEISNGHSVVRSDIGHFQTLPNTLPVLGDLVMIYKGPFSAAFQCTLVDDGGEALTTLAFTYQEKGTENGKLVEVPLGDEGVFTGKLQGLEMGTTYIVSAYAVNSIGETYSTPVEFTTSEAVYNSVPGMLPEIMGNQKYNLTRLTLSGFLNGTDIRLLREMLGWDIEGHETPGQLVEMDLSEAKIVEGGSSYYGSRYTRRDTLDYGMFLRCSQLQRIVLPHSLKVIEKDAFKGCSSLISMTIPDSLVVYKTSSGCSALQELSVSPLNTTFSSIDGVLYNKDASILIHYPEGKTAEEFTFPSSVRKIGVAAFQNCLLDSIIIPVSVEELGEQVFRGSRLKKIVISDGVYTIPEAAFKECAELKELVLGKEISALFDYCLDGCNLQELYLMATYPPVCYSSTFTGAGDIFNVCTLYVPSGRKPIYRQAKGWGNFLRINEQ